MQSCKMFAALLVIFYNYIIFLKYKQQYFIFYCYFFEKCAIIYA